MNENKNFDRAIEFILKKEGGYVNDPQDPGGETNFGISKKAYPNLDIKNLTEGQAREIYKKDYWDKAGCEVMAWPDCLIQLDTAVNMGVGRAKEFAGKAVNWQDYLLLRIDFYRTLVIKKPSQRVFLLGWINRVIDLWGTIKAI
mgnify:CR=1 FL=1